MYSVTEAFVAWLADQGYAAHTYPPKSGSEFVTVERLGGNTENLIDYPSMALQVWAKTAERAEELANSIRLALLTGNRPHGVYRAIVDSGPYPFYDEDTRMPRYQLVLDCTSQLTD